jgi:hypothetical protein
MKFGVKKNREVNETFFALGVTPSTYLAHRRTPLDRFSSRSLSLSPHSNVGNAAHEIDERL